MISAVPVELGHGVYVIAVGQSTVERGWCIGSQVITIDQSVPDDHWASVATKFAVLKVGETRNIVRVMRNRMPVVMFRSLAEITAENCIPGRLRYYDEVTFLEQPKRSSPRLHKGVTRLYAQRDEKWERTAVEQYSFDWKPLARALVELGRYADQNMPPSLALTESDLQWACRKKYLTEALDLASRVQGPQ